MKRLICVSAAIGLIATGFIAAPAQAEPKSGPLTNQTWDDEIEVTDNIVVDTLTIEDGARIEAQGDFTITVTQKLTVAGEESNPVEFFCKGSGKICWGGIRLAGTAADSSVEWAEFSEARIAIQTNQQAWSIEDSTFSGNTVGASISGAPDESTGEFVHNIVEGNDTGVQISSRLKTFELNGITDNDKFGVDFRTTGGVYSDNNIYDNGDLNATSCEQLGSGEINANGNWWGSANASTVEDGICDGISDPGHATIKYSSFEDIPVADAAGAPAPTPTSSPSPTTGVSPSPSPAVEHARTVTLSLKRHLRAKGAVSVSDGYVGCVPSTVTLRRKPFGGGGFRNLKQIQVDPSTGIYSSKVKDRQGTYQVTVGPSATDTDVCLAAKSTNAKHKHR